MKQYKKVLSMLLVGTMALGMVACGNEQANDKKKGNEVVDPFGKYEKGITVTTMMSEDGLRSVPEGMTLEDNPWINLYKEYGIELKYDFTALTADLATKLNMAIANDSLPDIFVANSQQFQELAEAGKLADLTELIEQYASEELKKILYYDGGAMMENASVNGKQYGLTYPQDYADFIPVVCVRTDWMEEYNLSQPETIADVWEIAKVFKDNNAGGSCSIGVGMTKSVTSSLEPTLQLLNGYGAYIDTWLEEDGKLVNSNIQPELKDALRKLNKYYEEGLIDPEFGSKDSAQLMEDALSGKTGVIISHYCAPFDLTNGIANGQQWSFFRLPTEDGGTTKKQTALSANSILCYSADGDNPEALIKLLNITTKYYAEEAATYQSSTNFSYPFFMIEPNLNNWGHVAYLNYLETGDNEEIVKKGFWDAIFAPAEEYRKNGAIEGYAMWGVYGPDGTEVVVTWHKENDGYMISKYGGATTETMASHQAVLSTMTEQMITDIIKGTKSVDYFDEYVTEWKKNGGDAITEEVNAWYSKQ